MAVTVRSLRTFLEEVYGLYHRPEFITPDPLEFLPAYDDPLERELAGILASALAYGNVRVIVSSVSAVLDKMGPSPRGFITASSRRDLEETFRLFRHRFTTGYELSEFIHALGCVLRRFGSLENCFLNGYDPRDPDTVRALDAFACEIGCFMGRRKNSLLPTPSSGSACKRLHLFLRWMVRSDEVDPGGWSGVSRSRLVVPLDVHMHAIGLALGLTARRQADLKTALEMTRVFREIDPEDPVRFDFSLTRMGMRRALDPADLSRIGGLNVY
jgi:uncharacterized protein (TIGR02757 family)